MTESVGPLLDLLGGSIPEGGLRRIRFLYDFLFRKTFFSAPLFGILRTRPGRSSMDVYLEEFTYHRQQLESADPGAHVSDSVLGYSALLRSDLTKAEQCHVFAEANTSYSFPRLGQILRDEYPEGTHDTQHQPMPKHRHSSSQNNPWTWKITFPFIPWTRSNQSNGATWPRTQQIRSKRMVYR